jgi:gluconokinase
MTTKPKSAYEETAGMMWFPRMLDKIRLHASDDLHPDFHSYLGMHFGVDGICCRFLRVSYPDLKNRVLEGGTDEEILQWCFEHGRNLDETDLFIWNEFIKKFGWNDRATPVLEKFKEQSGLSGRNDLMTMVEYMEVDEGRKP